MREVIRVRVEGLWGVLFFHDPDEFGAQTPNPKPQTPDPKP